MLRKFLKSKIQKGQSLVFFAIILPFMFLFIGAAADFGWLYLNQSRLQNAADSAVIAGAKEIIYKEENERDYYYLVSNTDEKFLSLANDENIYEYDLEAGDSEAKKYAKINLSSFLGNEDLEIIDVNEPEKAEVPDQWGKVKFKRVAYGVDHEDNDAIYYAVILSEKLEHLFDIMNNFEIVNLNSKAMAVAKITNSLPPEPPHGPSLYSQMVLLRANKTYSDWQKIQEEFDSQLKKAKNDPDLQKRLDALYGTTNTLVMARMRSVQAKGNEYVVGNYYRTETLTLHGASIAVKEGGNEDNNGKVLYQTNFNSLFVDFKIDATGTHLKDVDSGSVTNGNSYNLDVNNKNITRETSYNLDVNNNSINITGETILKYRIHDLINIGKWNGSGYTYEYKVRDNREPPDNLYVYIENEDSYAGGADNTVRQIIINVNAANTAADDRPMFIFYDGPQKYYGVDAVSGKAIEGNTQRNSTNQWKEKWRETWKHLGYKDNDYIGNERNSLPVILNLNADFNGVIFMPNSPIVINGNQNSFKGFIVAERFLRLKEAYDFPIKAENATSYGYVEHKDSRGNEYYKNTDNIVYYHKKAEGGTRYIQKIKVGGEMKSGNVIYATGTYNEVDLNSVSENAKNIYEVYDEISDKTKYVEINDLTGSDILYTYTLVEQEKTNLSKTFAEQKVEKDYLPLNPMYIDQFGNVQYMPLNEGYKYDVRPTPLDSAWHASYSQDSDDYDKWDDANEIIFKPSTFNLKSVEYSCYNKITLVDYTKLNDADRNINDVFYTTIRSDWID